MRRRIGCIVATASAQTALFSIYGVPCQAIADTELYKYYGDKYVTKGDTGNHIVQIRHTVTQSSANETNRIAAYSGTTGKSMGASWKPADGAYYPINSNAIVDGNSYTAAGRGNTNYVSKYGISSITITGTIDSYD